MNATEGKKQFENELIILKELKRLNNGKGKDFQLRSIGFPRLLSYGYLEEK
jgi:hypothetical protein